ncbi:hypothetical protein GCM10010964_09110 [Caldovatus sediminis]|uniref:Uncharacterized protein n=1 Tax=Caldovatus sediminis TaxID=2041189 RepID=A0A8J2Z8N5_9PROT|nr:hypothetical protein [Caldovatus sediminis]GGG23140.1 hypothetical protein GCM10010964_09110 [Caldovatus sediminis]
MPAPTSTPPPEPDGPLAATSTAIESLSATLALADALVASGRAVDLTGLEEEVEAICAALLALAPPCAATRGLRPALERLVGQVDRLRAGLAAARPATG